MHGMMRAMASGSHDLVRLLPKLDTAMCVLSCARRINMHKSKMPRTKDWARVDYEDDAKQELGAHQLLHSHPGEIPSASDSR